MSKSKTTKKKEETNKKLTDIEKEEFLKLLKCYKNDKNDQHIEKLDKYIFRFIEPQISKYRSIIENKQLERSGLIFMINNEPFGFNKMSNYFNNIPFFGNNINQSVVEFINKVKQCIFCGKSLILVKESNIARYLKGYEMKLFNKEGQLLQIRQQLVDNEMINKKLKNCKVELRYKGYYDRVNYDEYKLINDDINKEILNIITINAFDLLSQLKREITLLIMFMEKAKDELVHFPSLYEHDQFIECNKYFNVEIGSICKYYDEWMMEMKMNIFSELLCWRMKAFESFKLMNLCDINIIIV
ncbi:hypothetical protein ABK040_001026 [Willaertia magna]